VQDQVSGQEIVRGPKMGCFFCIRSFFFPRSISNGFSPIAINNNWFWHKKLGHFNFVILEHLMKHVYLNNTDEFFLLSFDCTPYKLGKCKSLPFYLEVSHAFRCFKIIHSDIQGLRHVFPHA
jgi:hypothetical protein